MKRYTPSIIVYIISLFCLALFIAGGILLTAGLPVPHEHVGAHISATQATCTNAGNPEYWHCEECGKYFSDELLTVEIARADTVIAQLPHTEEIIEGSPATCTASGISDGKRCAVCNTVTLEQTVIAKLPHKEETIEGTPATCTASGISHGKRCTVCENITLEQHEIAALGHDLDFTEQKPSTCYEQGNPDYYHCARCGKNFAEEECTTTLSQDDILYPLADHTYKQCFDNTRHYKAATCGHELETDDGEHNFTDSVCADCGFCNYGVTYALNDDGTAYTVKSRTTYSTYPKDVVIYPEYGGLPVTAIASKAFYGNNLTGISLPASVTEIGEKALSDCSSLEAVTVVENNPVFESKGNCLIDKETRTLVAGCKTSVIPQDSSVISIGNYAFYHCENLTAITIPYSVTHIGNHAFTHCDALTEIIIPERVTSIDEYAFSWCDGLTSISIPERVTEISAGMFASCQKLEELNLSFGVKSIGHGAFSSCTALKNFDIPASVTSIDNTAFYGCESLTELHVPASVTSIDDTAFLLCTGLEEITVDDNNPVYSAKGNCLIKYDYYVVFGCKNSVIPDDGSIRHIGSYAFYYCPITEINIPESVTGISFYSFCCCEFLTSLHIPKKVRYIDESAFVNMSGLTEITADPENTYFAADGNCLIKKESKTLILGCANSVIPDDGSVTSIQSNAFRGATVERIVIPESVTQTDLPYFNSCTELKEVIILGNIEKIPKDAFSGCTSLENVTLPESLIEIGDYAFKNCTSLTEIIMPNSVNKLGLYPFYNCTALSKVKLSDGLTKLIYVEPFGTCDNITEVDTGNGLLDLYDLRLNSLDKLKAIVIGSGITEINTKSGFYYMEELTTVTIGGNVTKIKKNSFRRCTALTDIYYDGTKEQWLDIIEDGWDYKSGDYTIHFNDGTTMQKVEE